MLHFVTDIKNFAIGTLTEPFTRAAHWGMQGLRGLMIPGIIAAFAVNPAVGGAIWLGGAALMAGAGAVSGIVTGGFGEMYSGWKARQPVPSIRHRLAETEPQPEPQPQRSFSETIERAIDARTARRAAQGNAPDARISNAEHQGVANREQGIDR